jgi:hypothetical protein
MRFGIDFIYGQETTFESILWSRILFAKVISLDIGKLISMTQFNGLEYFHSMSFTVKIVSYHV